MCEEYVETPCDILAAFKNKSKIISKHHNILSYEYTLILLIPNIDIYFVFSLYYYKSCDGPPCT